MKPEVEKKIRMNTSTQHRVHVYKKYVLCYFNTNNYVISYPSPCHNEILHSEEDIYCKLLYSKLLYFSLCLLVVQGSGKRIGIATRYGLDGPGIEYQWGMGSEIFCTLPDRSPGPTKPPVQCVTGHFQE